MHTEGDDDIFIANAKNTIALLLLQHNCCVQVLSIIVLSFDCVPTLQSKLNVRKPSVHTN